MSLKELAQEYESLENRIFELNAVIKSLKEDKEDSCVLRVYTAEKKDELSKYNVYKMSTFQKLGLAREYNILKDKLMEIKHNIDAELDLVKIKSMLSEYRNLAGYNYTSGEEK